MEQSLEITIENFKKIDINDACRKSGATLREESSGQKVIVLPYLDREYLIYIPKVGTDTTFLIRKVVSVPTFKNEVESGEKITLLHYLITSKGTPLTGKLVDFRQVPDGNFYYSTLVNLVHKPFLQTFGEKPQLFLKVGKSLKGSESDLKDFSMKFLVLPKVSITVVFYKGDEEFPPDCKFLFDSNISDHLSTEGIVKVCEGLVKELAGKYNEIPLNPPL